MSFAAFLLIALADAASSATPSQQRPMSSTVLGPQNPLLEQGAQALQAGHAEEGVRLTLEGLNYPSPAHDMAAARANLCAGYVLLHRYDEALAQCNTSITLDGSNWRAFNNRAAVYTAQGLYDRALEDIFTALKLAPGASLLHRSLSIIYQDRKLHRQSAAPTV
ncbi:MAG TPA: tetratricopeptide repeat protein [Steroidobacteraceae bacterium]|nr:tetratricopeptide repeat protein [Steroidobacteraceae bacterium]